MKTISIASSSQGTNISKAANATNQIVEFAKAIHAKQFSSDDAQVMLPSIIQALATVYAGEIAPDKK